VRGDARTGGEYAARIASLWSAPKAMLHAKTSLLSVRFLLGQFIELHHFFQFHLLEHQVSNQPP